MNRLLLTALLLPAFTHAAQVITAPSPDTPTYSIVVVDSRKLKTPLRDALAAYPGEECLPSSDLNAALNCPGLAIYGAVSYNFIEGFPKWPDPKDPRKELRINGLKTKSFSNFVTPGPCWFNPDGSVSCPLVPPPRPVDVHFTRPATEFGFMFQPNRPGFEPFISGFQVTVNGVDLGFYPVAPSGVQYLGVSAPEGLQDVRVVGVSASGGPGVVGSWYGHRLYYR